MEIVQAMISFPLPIVSKVMLDWLLSNAQQAEFQHQSRRKQAHQYIRSRLTGGIDYR
jgi:hypothetical protein